MNKLIICQLLDLILSGIFIQFFLSKYLMDLEHIFYQHKLQERERVMEEFGLLQLIIRLQQQLHEMQLPYLN